jgi:DNA-binding CsgD family transcriptional regulator
MPGSQVETRPFEFLQRAYDLDLTHLQWQSEVVDGLSALFPEAQARFGFVYELENGAIALPHAHHSPDGVPSSLVGDVIQELGANHQAETTRLFDTIQCSTLSQRLEELEANHVAQLFQENGIVDCAAICAGNASGMGFFFGAFLDTPTTLQASFRRRWLAVASHLAAIRRLHVTLSGSDPLEKAEMVFDPKQSKILDLRGSAQTPTTRERLRRAALNLDQLKLAKVSDDERLSRWQALVAGQWSLVDVFDSDGRRFVIALANSPEGQRFAGLSRKQAQIVWYLLQGHSQTFIGYELGLSQSTIAYHLQRARQVFRASDDSELIARIGTLLHGESSSAHLQDLEILVAADRPDSVPEDLPEALRETLTMILGGQSPKHIAMARGVSIKTAQNQIAELYRRFDVNSRHELVARLKSQ